MRARLDHAIDEMRAADHRLGTSIDQVETNLMSHISSIETRQRVAIDGKGRGLAYAELALLLVALGIGLQAATVF